MSNNAELSEPMAELAQYQYRSLMLGMNYVRLLRLLPSEQKGAVMECQLFEYTSESAEAVHLYEALSYVLGRSRGNCVDCSLIRLRDNSLDRILWIDAICINQADDREKEQQIQLMPIIYGLANTVVVWLLGKAKNAYEHEDDQILEDLRVIADTGRADHLGDQILQCRILRLLDRPWFRRM
ncbi:hypothetical protein BU25DRAFT_431297 [Macroventuria anomochaeta]|uniref:Uncharacterized protein n=1 Tax=Macroventuria anomochaeta TaxID=301207 RepID=A0ACB6S1V3_9PLEO|nr:uncharacterized protein BU25DRAFT_431297 [Macroventuria anomochaeta]KAF2627492.1 hypothetical protein BU25DRAFT_431297 [Macroventuria anomochaeta]